MRKAFRSFQRGMRAFVKSDIVRDLLIGAAMASFAGASFALAYRLITPYLETRLGPTITDTETAALFATATIVLTAFGILVAVLGFVGWSSMEKFIQSRVDSILHEEREYDQALARVTQGVIFSSLYELTKPEVDPGFECGCGCGCSCGENPRDAFRADILDRGIRQCESALAARAFNEKAGLPRFACKNNLAYLLALRGHEKDGGRALQLIRECKSEGHLYYANVPASLTTEAAVLAAFGRNQGVSRDEAKILKRKLSGYEAATPYECFEVQHALEKLCEVVPTLEGSAAESSPWWPPKWWPFGGR